MLQLQELNNERASMLWHDKTIQTNTKFRFCTSLYYVNYYTNYAITYQFYFLHFSFGLVLCNTLMMNSLVQKLCNVSLLL